MPPPRSRKARLPALAALLAAGLLGACSRAPSAYDASTPDAVLDSAQRMIRSGEADRLADLIYAENDQMRSFLNQFALLFASLQKLGVSVDRRFPEELRQFREQADLAAAAGRSNPILAQLSAAARSGRSSGGTFGTAGINREGLTLDTGAPARPQRRPPMNAPSPRTESERQRVNEIIKSLLVDPYRWLDEGRDRLGTISINDDTVALTWDGHPILPPFGLSLTRQEGRWFLVPPTSYPGINRIMPRSDDEWFIWGSMIRTLQQVVDDLNTDVDSGRIRNLTDLADTAVEKTAIPALLIFFAYSNLVEARNREAAAAHPSTAPTPPETPDPEGP